MEAPFRDALLVEDEPRLAAAIEIALGELGITVARAGTLASARRALDASPFPTLVVLDRWLPDGDGISLATDLRARGFAGAILVLSAHGETGARVEGLDAGADDYLPKPFAWEELAARVRALARRARAPEGRATVAPGADGETWSLDGNRFRVLGPGGWVELTPLEFRLASCLIRAGGRVVSRAELLRTVWGFTLIPKTRTVDAFLSRLRRRFEPDPDSPRYFLTLRGAGYRFQLHPSG